MQERKVRAGAPRKPPPSLPLGEVAALSVSKPNEPGAPGDPLESECSMLIAKLGC